MDLYFRVGIVRRDVIGGVKILGLRFRVFRVAVGTGRFFLRVEGRFCSLLLFV